MEKNQTNVTIPHLLSVKEAAKSLCISERTLFTLTSTGRIQSVRIGPHTVRYDVRDLEAFIRAAKGM